MSVAAAARRRAPPTGPARRTRAGMALVAGLAMALALAPATAGIDVRVVHDDGAGSAASLTARWPVMVDASQRTAVGPVADRTLALPTRSVLVALPAPARTPLAAVPEPDTRPLDLSMIGLRRTDGG